MLRLLLLAILLYGSWALPTPAQVPHNQDRPPGPPLSPEEAIAKMQTPAGFEVALFASEPDLVNPVAMTFDDRGRVWVTESLEYPRLEAGEGQDRIKILEDTDGDGKADKTTIFAEGLNIPSGIAIGNGGVYVANAPDLLFLKDTNGDDRADTREILLHGFGRFDTHELPCCLTWGPDGWLYGLNGVFNHSKIEHQGRTYSFTCALWRYHPKTKAFELFCEGTSNPWGLDYDREGSFFVSACVIDHLWHLTETGYYHRQAGPYPPFTWKIESIVKHQHQKAAYCGLTIYDADRYPAEYRQKLFMGNIHGGCLNSDQLQRQGASYFGTPCPDFLTADDAWFMPVSQQVGPDGFLWVLDWYDRFHCYQDARREPEGIDRLKGRLYRVTYGDPSPPKPFDLAKKSDEKLVQMLGDGNVFYRRRARRLLVERNVSPSVLEDIVLKGSGTDVAKMETLWTRLSLGGTDESFLLALMEHDNPTYRAWGVRTAGDSRMNSRPIADRLAELARDPHPDVRLQVAIAAGKIPLIDSVSILLDVLSASSGDESGLTARIVWQNLHPLLPAKTSNVIAWLSDRSAEEHSSVTEIAERLVGRLISTEPGESEELHRLFDLLLIEEKVAPLLTGRFLEPLLDASITGELVEHRFNLFRSRFESKLLKRALSDQDDKSLSPEEGFAVLLGNDTACERAASILVDSKAAREERLDALQALVKARPQTVVDSLDSLLVADDPAFASELLPTLARLHHPQIANAVLANYPKLPAGVRPQALDLLTSRSQWAETLIAAVELKSVPASDVNANQLRKMMHLDKGKLRPRVENTFGKVREDRDRGREQVIGRVRHMLTLETGDSSKGKAVFTKVCAQCHKFNGEGNDVGPDLTSNGRSSLDQLLSNLLDPNLVIGKDYQARVVATADGRILTGLVTEDSEGRVVLKVAGGKLEVIPKGEIDEMRDSAISLMPEKLETQISDPELRDLIAYLLSIEVKP